MKKYYEKLLKEFISAESTSGNSEEVAFIFKQHAEKLLLSTGVDILGSVVARLNRKTCRLQECYSRKILITAHQDTDKIPIDNINKLDKTIKGKYRAPGLDNKAGLLSMCMLMEFASKSKIYDNIFFVATSLDKNNGLGSFVCSEKVVPTIAINIDVIEVSKKSLLGKGPVILNNSIINKKLFCLVNEIKSKYNIPTQYITDNNVIDNNCREIVKTAGGVACCDIRIPLFKYQDFTESVSKKDIENCTKLTHKLIQEINKVENFLPEV